MGRVLILTSRCFLRFSILLGTHIGLWNGTNVLVIDDAIPIADIVPCTPRIERKGKRLKLRVGFNLGLALRPMCYKLMGYSTICGKMVPEFMKQCRAQTVSQPFGLSGFTSVAMGHLLLLSYQFQSQSGSNYLSQGCLGLVATLSSVEIPHCFSPVIQTNHPTNHCVF